MPSSDEAPYDQSSKSSNCETVDPRLYTFQRQFLRIYPKIWLEIPAKYYIAISAINSMKKDPLKKLW